MIRLQQDTLWSQRRGLTEMRLKRAALQHVHSWHMEGYVLPAFFLFYLCIASKGGADQV